MCFLKILAKSTEKQIGVGGYNAPACNFIREETWTQVFSCGFYKSFKNNYFVEHLGTTTFLYQQT